MKKTERRPIEVWAHWIGMKEPSRLGVLYAIPASGKEVFSFEYDEAWLQSGKAQMLDPRLSLSTGPQYPSADQKNFGLFLDSSPDRWGRFLLDRREAQAARKEDRPKRTLVESDYLLGVFDEHRMGALRFRTKPNGPFLDNNKAYASPPSTSLRELEHASLELQKDGAEASPSYSKWLTMLIAPGGSLGGARPKASVVDPKGSLWIAKFPSLNDEIDIGAWEKVVHNLAIKSQITTSQANLQKFSGRFHTFMTKRFDRNPASERIHFASAMTLLQRSDGDDASHGASYLELAELIATKGAQPAQDLEQLWRRIVFFICVSNVDDHLRNHGFLLDPRGWLLAPAYDMNPVETGNGLKLNISFDDNSQDLDLARETAREFRIKKDRANEIIQEVVTVVKNWREEAKALGISNGEQRRMEHAFRVVAV